MDNQTTTLFKNYITNACLASLFSVGSDVWDMSFKRNIAIIRQWKVEHEKEYAHFKAEVMRVSYGDFSAYKKIFRLGLTCIPLTILQDIKYILTSESSEPTDIAFEEMVTDMANAQGYLEFSREDIEDEDKGIEDMHLDIVTEKRNEEKYCYERIPCALEFFYHLPWDWQCAMRTMMPKVNDMELANISRRLYVKICLLQEEIMKNMAMIGEKRDAFTMCLMYFIVFDHGLKTAYQALTRSLDQEQNLGVFGKTVIPTMKRLISTSIEKGYDTKMAWSKTIRKDCHNPRLRDDLLLVAKDTKGVSGRPKTATNIPSINSILTGNVDATLTMIKEYRKEHDRPVDLAYLLLILEHAKLTNVNFYTDFHRAMEEYEGKKYSLRNPQEVYNSFPFDSEILDKRGTTYQKRKALETEEWVRKFISSCKCA